MALNLHLLPSFVPRSQTLTLEARIFFCSELNPYEEDDEAAPELLLHHPFSREEQALLENTQSSLHCCNLEALDREAAQSLVPGLCVPFDFAVYMPHAVNIHPKRYLQALFLACQNLADESSASNICEERELNLFRETIKSLRQLADEYDAMIICLGAKVDMLPELAGKLPLRSCRGVVAELQLPIDARGEYGDQSPSILSDAWLAFQGPRSVSLGSTYKKVGFCRGKGWSKGHAASDSTWITTTSGDFELHDKGGSCLVHFSRTVVCSELFQETELVPFPIELHHRIPEPRNPSADAVLVSGVLPRRRSGGARDLGLRDRRRARRPLLVPLPPRPLPPCRPPPHPSDDDDDEGEEETLRFRIRPWSLWKRRGSKRFPLKRRRRFVDLAWDLTRARFSGAAAPEPAAGYFVSVAVDGEVVLVAGDLRGEAAAIAAPSAGTGTTTP
uniref:FAD dependent oxidoreductase domain-containing protein n=1 Tax=Ananas comosus var. bracteatus TaxID=296719 RepID=A0A6V7PAC5_ANACO|nr:unnamed protein product [Ananas comosus var. bracteatus]